MNHAPKMIASGNALEALRTVYPSLEAGSTALEACVAAATIVEDDPEDLTVGYGGLPNAEGEVELDASVMCGRTGRVGAVAALKGIRHPTQVARLVMEQTERVLLVGDGAARFARSVGFPEEDLLTETSRKLWQLWRRRCDQSGNYPKHHSDLESKRLIEEHPTIFDHLPTGTVHISALDVYGNLACATSTSGHAFKLPGRVGDSAMAGAGFYADNALGACGSVGCGELNLQSLTCFAIVQALRRGGNSRQLAAQEASQAIQRHQKRLQESGNSLESLDVRYFILTPDGHHFGVSLKSEQSMAVADARNICLEALGQI